MQAARLRGGLVVIQPIATLLDRNLALEQNKTVGTIAQGVDGSAKVESQVVKASAFALN